MENGKPRKRSIFLNDILKIGKDHSPVIFNCHRFLKPVDALSITHHILTRLVGMSLRA